ncbi:V-type ATP synthase subunit C [Thermococcus gammatolerans]|uniref:A-type ATP synthase subunit C n=1 Tax=Thermococcus gammatolerans (strain DSM 15229 / JCM 11827 / EJ3) TaxID=593117 RepID=AATC_THEGJ|nr:V-type ATP synthase subunit C [Thermococcus gammatolerans]C5A334.1 RecName: Full=V-type ATP synthase subunit C; AltName: Full=V-ATPase subunit C [Thermococcus gammatolerans EJ3]ACS32646.1 Archaeal/vacuolar-type H+ ATPase, subunit C (atpC) [Thermococcus gammatolerans EJ3]
MGAETVTAILDTTLGVVFTWLGWKTAKIIRKYTPYSYPNARINAMEAKLLTGQRFNELAESRTLQNFIVNLEDTDYKVHLSGVTEDPLEIERAFERALASTYLLMEEILPKRVSGFFRLLLEEWDVRNIASVVKAKVRGEPAIDYVVEIGTMVPKVKAIAEAKTMEEILVILEGTPYEEHYQRLLLGEIDVDQFETELYKVYYSRLLEYATSRKEEERLILEEFVRTKIDIRNIVTLLRAKRAGLPGEVIKRHLIPGGSVKLDTALNVDDLGMALAELDSTKYGKVLRDEREKIEKDLTLVEPVLQNHLLRRMEELTRFYPLSVATPLSYILKKEREIKKLRAMAKLIADGFEPEKIKEIIGEELA